MKYLKIFEYFDPFSHLKKKPYEELEPKKVCVLKFTLKGNNKINHPYLSLPAAYTCPSAKDCKSFAKIDPKTGRTKLHNFGTFTCYAAAGEKVFPNLRKRNWANYDLLKTCKNVDEISTLISDSLKYHFPFGLSIFRLHESGDFFSQDYFDAWVKVAKDFPDTIFYTYTKSLQFWINRIDDVPDNFKLNASLGGKEDDLIDKYNLKYVLVAKNIEEAIDKKLNIDVNDDLAWRQDKPFAILLHGQQPKGSGLNVDVKQNKKLIKSLS